MATTVFPPRSRAAAPQAHGLIAALATLIASWRYAGAKRDLRFDLLRGLAVIAMVTDHVGGQESWLYTLTGGNRFWTSAAEGFIFISGLVMGIVYPAVIARDGIGAAVKKAMRRAGTLYLLTVTLTLTTAALAFRLGLHWAPQVDANSLPDFVIGVLTLHRSYYLTDVLLLYTLVIFIAAGALYLMATQRSWIVLVASWSLWSLWQFFPQQVTLPWAITDNSVFNLSAWQLLFCNGLLIGFHRKARTDRTERHHHRPCPGRRQRHHDRDRHRQRDPGGSVIARLGSLLPRRSLARAAWGGVGLGLAIVRAIVEAHGGTVIITSTVGSGTAVTMTFPIVPTATKRPSIDEEPNGLTTPRAPEAVHTAARGED